MLHGRVSRRIPNGEHRNNDFFCGGIFVFALGSDKLIDKTPATVGLGPYCMNMKSVYSLPLNGTHR